MFPSDLEYSSIDGEYPFTPVQGGNSDIIQTDNPADFIDRSYTQDIPVEDTNLMTGKAVIAAGIGSVVFPEGSRAFGHIVEITDRFIEDFIRTLSIAGKEFRRLDCAELEALDRKLRAMISKKKIKS